MGCYKSSPFKTVSHSLSIVAPGWKEEHEGDYEDFLAELDTIIEALTAVEPAFILSTHWLPPIWIRSLVRGLPKIPRFGSTWDSSWCW